MKRIEPLSDAECETLRAAWKEGPNSRVRQRVQAVYLANRGYGRIALSALFEVGVDTISAWLDGWEQAGLRGLYDEPVREGRRSTRQMKPRACACGWTKNPANSSRRTHG